MILLNRILKILFLKSFQRFLSYPRINLMNREIEKKEKRKEEKKKHTGKLIK